jgi:single-strand DNA-binding protein
MSQSSSSTATAPAAPTESTQYEPDTILLARLTADPQLRHTASTGKPVTTLRVAEEHTNPQRFHDVVCWGRTAEVVCQYLKQGRLIEVTGREQERTYTASDGERTVEEIVAFRVQFLPGRESAAAVQKERSSRAATTVSAGTRSV